MKIKLLRKARKILGETPERYTHVGVCSAIADALEQMRAKESNYRAIVNIQNETEYLFCWIRRMLNGNSYLNGWLRNRGYPVDTDYAMLRATRLAWIDWMIAELERTGEKKP